MTTQLIHAVSCMKATVDGHRHAGCTEDMHLRKNPSIDIYNVPVSACLIIACICCWCKTVDCMGVRHLKTLCKTWLLKAGHLQKQRRPGAGLPPALHLYIPDNRNPLQ